MYFSKQISLIPAPTIKSLHETPFFPFIKIYFLHYSGLAWLEEVKRNPMPTRSHLLLIFLYAEYFIDYVTYSSSQAYI